MAKSKFTQQAARSSRGALSTPPLSQMQAGDGFKAPNWKDPAQYPADGEASNERFAWEFLRRNSAYQAAWLFYVAKLKHAASGNDELLRFVECIAAPAAHATRLCGPFQEPDPWNRAASALFGKPELWVATDNGRLVREPLRRHMGQPWGLEGMVNPAREYTVMYVRFLARKVSHHPTAAGVEELEGQLAAMTPPQELDRSKWLILQIDLEQPLRVIEATARWAIKTQRQLRKSKGWIKPLEARARSPAMLVHYLRILDATAQDVTATRIGEILKPTQSNVAPEYGRDKTIKAALRAAIKLRDGEYRLLPVLQEQSMPTAE